jgi:hypothetical protein
LNLEQNGIESWDELAGFRVLAGLQKLIVNKNRLKEIYRKPGFADLRYFSFEDNLISDWKSFDQLNEFDGRIKQIRCAGNPLFQTNSDADQERKQQNQYIAIAKIEFLNSFNGSKINEFERKDAEIYYLKHAYLTYLRDVLQAKEGQEQQVESLDDPGLGTYVAECHPRFFELAQTYGSPIGLVSLKSQKNNIARVAAQIELASEVHATQGKVLKKKLLLTMTVTQLKSMCSKLFKADLLKI